MTTAKNESFIWLKQENCYLVGGGENKNLVDREIFLSVCGKGKRENLYLVGGTPPIPKYGKFWSLGHCTPIARVMVSNLLHSWSHIHHLQSCCNHLVIEVRYRRDWPWSRLEKGSSKLFLVIT